MRSSSVGVVCVLLTLVVYVAQCKNPCPQWCCKGPEIAQLPPHPRKCDYPPNGWWDFVHWAPEGPCRSTLAKSAVSRVFLHRVYDTDLYLGSGAMHLLQLPFTGNNPVDVMVQYNDQSCTLAGTFYAGAGITATDAVAWTYDAAKQTLEGYVVQSNGGFIPYNTRSWMAGTYDGLQECMPASLVWVIPPEPSTSPAGTNTPQLNACDDSYWSTMLPGGSEEPRDESVP